MDNETAKKIATWLGVGRNVIIDTHGEEVYINVTLESFDATSLKIRNKRDGKIYTVSYDTIMRMSSRAED